MQTAELSSAFPFHEEAEGKTLRAKKFRMLPACLGLALCCAPAAFAAPDAAQGKTSGPASGTPTAPNTAAEKQASASTNGHVATGAAGTEGKSGAESGPAPRSQTKHQ